ncbi:hypothetical protein ACKS0A_07593 [Histoplasma ohiense]
MSSRLSPTMIKSSGLVPHSLAICKIPAGSGFGRMSGVSRVMIGRNSCVGRCVARRWFTGVSKFRVHNARFNAFDCR